MPATNHPFIELRGIHKSFGSKDVLKGIDLTIQAGETVVILGGSGSGKSVLIRHVIGLLHPDEGQILIDGEDIAGKSEKGLLEVRKKIGMLFQSGALFDSMNVYDNVAYALHEHTSLPEGEIAERVAQKLELVGLPGIEGKMPSELSGGMRKRVALARSIALEPRCIMYDEPTTGLDPISSNRIGVLIRDLQQKLGITSIVVTHDIVTCYTVADRIAFLWEGALRFVGTPDEARRSKDEKLTSFLTGEGAYATLAIS